MNRKIIKMKFFRLRRKLKENTLKGEDIATATSCSLLRRYEIKTKSAEFVRSLTAAAHLALKYKRAFLCQATSANSPDVKTRARPDLKKSQRPKKRSRANW